MFYKQSKNIWGFYHGIGVSAGSCKLGLCGGEAEEPPPYLKFLSGVDFRSGWLSCQRKSP